METSRFTAMKIAIADAISVDELKSLHDDAEAMLVCARGSVELRDSVIMLTDLFTP